MLLHDINGIDKKNYFINLKNEFINKKGKLKLTLKCKRVKTGQMRVCQKGCIDYELLFNVRT